MGAVEVTGLALGQGLAALGQGPVVPDEAGGRNDPGAQTDVFRPARSGFLPCVRG
ncbi:hypothetical protein ACFYNZ_14385 [Streptomyces kebangsaanensis]|uniref:Uncharacterized protein n=1 Tax=Streptomyces kebangsaanensis TaxID=864058 RepID=A0ABW6KSC9_9ACTN